MRRILVLIVLGLSGGLTAANAQSSAAPGGTATAAQAMPSDRTSRDDTYEYWFGYGNAIPGGHWSHFGYAGFERALNQTSLYTSGPMLRADFGAGAYKPSVSFFAGSVMLGWREPLGPGYITLYGGPDFLWNNAPDTFYVHGPHAGGKVALQYQINGHVGGLNLFSFTSYSSIADAFSTYLRPGYRLTTHLRLGPEASFYNDRYYQEERVGGFLAYWFEGHGTLWVGGGWLNPHRNPNISGGYYAYVSWGVTQ